VVFGGILGGGGLVLAQIEPDGTLGTEITRDVIIRDILSDRIDGGTVRGANLFHSFEVFNVLAGRGVYFSNPDGIANILSRVTGNDPSEILGRLGVLGEANLFLINPNGILFGPNASLDIEGSFFATTADAIRLGNTGLFSATEPATSNLLAVNPSAFLFNAIAAQPILNQSQAASLISQPNSNGGSPGLQVRAGQTLGLIGGDVRLEGGNLTAAGGRIELGSVASVGEVSLSQMGNRFVLGYDSIAEFGDISLSEKAFVDASGEGGGDVQIRAARLGMRQGSFIFADTLGASPGGEVLVKTTESVTLSEGSRLTAEVVGTGTGGNLTIDTPRLLVQGRAVVSASTYDAGDAGNLTLETGELLVSQGGFIAVATFGEGNGGELTVNANQIELIDSGVLASVGPNATGDGGDVTISTQGLRIKDGANLSASTSGKGNSGDLTVRATDKIEVMGSPQGNSSTIRAQVNSGAKGNGGNLTLETGELLVSQGGQISVSTLGEGNGGQLNVNATQIELIGTNPINNRFPNGLFASVGDNATGTGGNVTVSTQGLRIKDGANLSASTSGKGNAGNLRVVATDRIEVMGSGPQGNASSIRAQVELDAKGNGGNLTLETGELLVSQGGQISVGTLGEGNGGQLNVNATQIELIGTNPINGAPSGLFARVELNAKGSGGNVTISTQGLRIKDGAQLSTRTAGMGNAGNLAVTATDKIEVMGTNPEGFPSTINALVRSTATGNGGNLNLNAPSILVTDKGELSVATFGNGTAGNLRIDTQRLRVTNDAVVSASTSSPNPDGRGGNLTINAKDALQLRNQGRIIAQSTGAAPAGDITINTGRLTATDGTIATSTQRSAGGAITITAKDIRLFKDSDITTRVASGAGGGGDITLTANSIVAFDDSDILAFARDGQGGDITFNTRAFFGENYRPAPKGTDPVTLDNNDRVDINASGAVEGVITLPDTSAVQNSLTPLSENQIDTNSLIASSCIARRYEPQRGSFFITGTGGIPFRPGDAYVMRYETGTVRGVPAEGDKKQTSSAQSSVTVSNTNEHFNPTTRRRWKMGDPIIEPTGIYQLPNGELIMSRECEQ
jgi:filamentous hemagglutinin family protein